MGYNINVLSVALVLVLCNNIGGSLRYDDICGNYNERRLYLELGERGIITAQNVTSTFIMKLQQVDSAYQYLNASSHEQCSLELVTCPACVIAVTFHHVNLSHHCGGANMVMDSLCHCDYVWLSEPPYEDMSGMPFCGIYLSLPTDGSGALMYRSLTRSLSLVLLFSESHSNAFTLEYSAERNRHFLKGSPSVNGILTRAGNVSHGGVLKSPFFPALYPHDLKVEYIITCQSDLSERCHVRVLFQDFQLATSSIMEFYDWNGQRLDLSTGLVFRPPVIVTSGPSLMIRFYANGGTGLGYKAIYSFVSGNLQEKSIQPITDCGGDVENLGGAITMMNMVTRGVQAYDCVWLIQPPKNYLHLKTHLYLKVSSFIDMAGNTELQVLRGLTSEQPLLETLRYPVAQIQPPRHKEHVVPMEVGFYVSLRGSFSATSRLAIVYTAFSYRDCFTGADSLCQNHRCIPSQLYCDGFDHCGDNSDEPATCSQDWKADPRQDHHWYSHTPNYYFPKIERYPDIKTATLMFVACSLGLVLLIASLIILLYRLGARARQQQQIQSHLQTITDLLDSNRTDDETSDDPPVYEAPPDYDEVIKIFKEPTENKWCKSRKEFRPDTARRSRSNLGNILLIADTPEVPSSVRVPTLEVALPPPSETSCRHLPTSKMLVLPTSDRYRPTSLASTSRSCQTTPIPDSPPPPYTATVKSVAQDPCSYRRNLLPPLYDNSQLSSCVSSPTESQNGKTRHPSMRKQTTRHAWLLLNDEESTSKPPVAMENTPASQSSSNPPPTEQYSQSSTDSDDGDTREIQYMPMEVNLCNARLAISSNGNENKVGNPELGLIEQLEHKHNHSIDNSQFFPQERQLENTIALRRNSESFHFTSDPDNNQMVTTYNGARKRESLNQDLRISNHSTESVSNCGVIVQSQFEMGSGQSSQDMVSNPQVSSGTSSISDQLVWTCLPEESLCSCEGACGCAMAAKKYTHKGRHMHSLSAEVSVSLPSNKNLHALEAHFPRCEVGSVGSLSMYRDLISPVHSRHVQSTCTLGSPHTSVKIGGSMTNIG